MPSPNIRTDCETALAFHNHPPFILAVISTLDPNPSGTSHLPPPPPLFLLFPFLQEVLRKSPDFTYDNFPAQRTSGRARKTEDLKYQSPLRRRCVRVRGVKRTMADTFQIGGDAFRGKLDTSQAGLGPPRPLALTEWAGELK